MAITNLKPPQNLVIDFKPSPKQYELWKLLQPDCCPHCGGHIIQALIGYDANGNPQYKPQCASCASQNLPQIILGGGAAGGGKALLINELVCTPFGFREVKDLKEGAIITNPKTGGMQRIIKVHPIEIHPYYRIHFVDKTYIDCSEGHLWVCHESRKKLKRAKYNNISTDRVWETKRMFEWYEKKKGGMYKGANLIIPLTEPVRFTPGLNTLEIDPYVLGALIGDGCMTSYILQKGYVEFINEDNEIVAQFEKAGYDMTKRWRKAPGSNVYHYLLNDKQLIASLQKYGIASNSSKTHRIPLAYVYSSIEERKRLMQGLIDTDGYVDDRGHITYTTISEQLANDVAWVVRSLGGVATITRGKAGYKNPDTGEYIQCNDAFDVQIRTKMNPELCCTSRKKNRATYEFNGGNSELGKRIVDIEYIGLREGRCITVDDPSGLYLTNDFTVTHNSYIGSSWIVSSCLRFPDLRAVIARKTIKSLKESTFNTIKAVMKQWGLKEGENYKINNLEGIVTFWNGSTILLKELEDLPSDSNFERLGSSEWTIGFVDEVSEISERAIEVLFSRLRWRTHETFKIPRLLMTTNPCITWIRSRFVQDDEGNPIVPKEGEAFVPFSIYDNPSTAFRQIYEAALNKITDPAVKARLLYGNWDFVETNESAAYWNFNGEHHLVDGLREKVYDPLKPIVLSFDFNVVPFMSSLAIQVDYDNKKVYVLEEVLGKPADKENNTPRLAQKLSQKYLAERHMGGILITGDPAGLARSTQTVEGVNNYTIILSNFHPTLRAKQQLLSKQPPQATRLEFVNNLLHGLDGWEILVDMRCRKLAEDLIYQKKNQDGTKEKRRVTDPKLGVKFEKYGHLSDALDYALCLLLSKEWRKFQSNGSSGIETVNAPIYGDFEY